MRHPVEVEARHEGPLGLGARYHRPASKGLLSTPGQTSLMTPIQCGLFAEEIQSRDHSIPHYKHVRFLYFFANAIATPRLTVLLT